MRIFALALVTTLSALVLQGCSATSVEIQNAKLGQASDMDSLLSTLNEPGLIVFEKHLSANWQVPLSGLLNLQHPKAISAGLADKDEAIQIFVYTLRHPIFGTFLVDSGISEGFIDAENNSDVSFIMKSAMNTSALDVVLTTKQVTERLAQQKIDIAGVLLTHIHFDHIMGLSDLGSDVPVYLGPGDAKSSVLTHMATQGTTDRLLRNVEYLQEWQYTDSGVIDVFGDGSLWAIHSPGHTPGTTAYLARTIHGPQLLLGDVTHTRWGWDNGVEPGSYSSDKDLNAVSLKMLKDLVENHPSITAHPGHQN